jgi:single-strand DNA-binding protein
MEENMNKVILMGRLTRDPDIRYSQGAESTQVARYTLAVDRRTKKDSSNNQQTADFISCVAFGRAAKFAEDYLAKGTKLVVEGRIQTGSYTNRDGNRVYTTDVIVESQEFAESRAAGGAGSSGRQHDPPPQTDDDGFMHIPDGIDEELPFD